jgi:hypothetical protein
MRKTTIVLKIEHPDDLDNVNEETIRETFDEAGDMSWIVTIVSVDPR